jgi:CelD/BcsL family acetyltransferase involved in cellulose biosynthesis
VIRVVDTESGFDELEGDWNRLSDRAGVSCFSTYDFVRCAWDHFHGPSDRLLLLVLTTGGSVEGIAPLYVGRCRTWGVPHRAIRFIATWEGDRPRLLASGSEQEFWAEILRFLVRTGSAGEALELFEQPAEGPGGSGWGFLPRGWHWEQECDAVGYYISLEGTWEDYLSRLDAHTRQEWRRRRKRLASRDGGLCVECVAEPDRMPLAVERFAALEQSGWKAAAGVGVGKDDRHRGFYRDLLVRFSGKGRARLYFLTSGGEDLAAKMFLYHRDVVYSRHLTYSPAHAAVAPGILLHAELIREHFGGPWRELDLLGMREDGAPPEHKIRWATGKRETVRWTGYRLRSRLLPFLLAKRFRDLCRGRAKGHRGVT